MRYLLSLVALVVVTTPVFAQMPVRVAADQQKLLQSSDPKLAANKKIVFDFWREVLQARRAVDAPKFLAEEYIQHNPTVANGRKGFMDYFGKMEPRAVKATIDNLVSIVAEGDLVVLALREELPEPKKAGATYTSTWFDMFRIANGKIVEHWDYGTK